MSDSTTSPPSPPPSYIPTVNLSSPLEPSLRHHISRIALRDRELPSLPVDDQPPDPTVLTWNPSETPLATSSRVAGAPGPQYIPRPIPPVNPPEYSEARLPTKPVVYTFSPLGFNSMIVVPPPDFPDTRPQYHISVHLNCFIPSSYITTIRRGATEYGDFVGDFEMGISDKQNTLYIRGKEFVLKEVLSRQSGPRQAGMWNWRFVKRALLWDCTKSSKVCSSKDRHTIYAKFTPSNSLRTPNQPVQLAQLEVMPEGQAMFDDILMSCLIIERWRLTPAHGEHKTLFDH